MAGNDRNYDSSGPSRYRYQSGLGHAPAYMVAGHPFLTGGDIANNTEVKIVLPFVAKKVVVVNSQSHATTAPIIRVSFRSQNDAGNADLQVTVAHQYIQLDGDEESMTFNVKCKEIYLKNVSGQVNGFQMYAELTGIPTGNMYTMTGSGISGLRIASAV
tara:strand:- start:331 stop:807 length:477 start_codon:yes stop_codon:yes gene_type:complete